MLSKRLRELREMRGFNKRQTAKLFNMPYTTYNNYETGTREPNSETLIVFAKEYNVSVDYLLGESDKSRSKLHDIATPFKKSKQIPILGLIRAGEPTLAKEDVIGYTYGDYNEGYTYFALRVAGDSMNAARIQEGDILVVREQSCVDDGEIAVILVDGEEATVKRVYRAGSTITLMPQSTNSEHKPQIYDLKKTDIKILGKVVKVEIEP